MGRIREVWGAAWPDKPILIEKSPPNIFRYKMLDREFPNSLFIGMIRHPYPQIEAWRRHFGNGKNVLHDYYVDWIRHAEWLARAKEELGPKMLLLNYEELIHYPTQTLNKITTFFPLLNGLRPNAPIIDNNEKSIAKFSYIDINHINDAILDRTMFTIERIKIERSLGLLERFGYDIFREEDLGDTFCRLFFSERYAPLIKNEKYVEYFKIMEDGLIHEPISSWMEYFDLARKHYQMLFYRRGYFI